MRIQRNLNYVLMIMNLNSTLRGASIPLTRVRLTPSEFATDRRAYSFTRWGNYPIRSRTTGKSVKIRQSKVTWWLISARASLKFYLFSGFSYLLVYWIQCFPLKFTLAWSRGTLCTVFKKGNRKEVMNYWGINIINIMAKLHDMILCSWIKLRFKPVRQ